MRKVFSVNRILLIIGLLLIGLLFAAYAGTAPGNGTAPKGADEKEAAPLMLQDLDYTENPVDIPNPGRGAYRGRWQNIPPDLVDETNSPFGITPEVDHRVPVDENSVLYHGRQVPPVEGDDIEKTQFYNGVNQNTSPYVGGTGVSALPAISFMGFDLCNFSSNAFLSAHDAFAYRDDGLFEDPVTGAARTGKTQPLTSFALDYIRGLLQKVRDGNGVALVKFSYDGNGFSYIEPHKYPHLDLTQGLIHGPEPTYMTENNPLPMCDVPGHGDKTWIEYHLWQLKPVLHEFEDIILCVKTGMLGPWGEQHSSPEARSVDAYKMLLDAYLDAVPPSRALLTHAGGFLAWYNETYGTSYTFTNIDDMPVPPRGSPEARFGFFNDSYAAGSWTDNGSLSEGNSMIDERYGGSTYDRYRVITWIHKQNQIVQGEGGIGDNVFGTMPGALIEARELRTTALNMRHGRYNRWNSFMYTKENVTKPVQFPADEEELRQGNFTGEIKTAVFDPVYEGRTGLEYVRDRLGYRLVLREAKASEWVEEDGVLRFEGKIQNVGFGNVINRKNVSVLLKSKTGPDFYSAPTGLDARNWLTDEGGNTRPDNRDAWRDLNFSVSMSAFGSVSAGDYEIYLKISEPKEQSANKRCIRFANKGNRWNARLGANLIGSTTVL
ncbi:MAG: DUF4832 domain-containing protein [Candidatus Marinimicrobia bacterium]|nr:DUF4832 domain-containing protein [Candidatus Neomarinimicrobiota bacterium]MCF7880810.1 DUF4832 domain-containing protein [Candidatus Neomarinimicrobiota bacterium]